MPYNEHPRFAGSRPHTFDACANPENLEIFDFGFSAPTACPGYHA